MFFLLYYIGIFVIFLYTLLLLQQKSHHVGYPVLSNEICVFMGFGIKDRIYHITLLQATPGP